MGDSDNTPKSDKKIREKDGVTSCEPTILQIPRLLKSEK